MAELKEAAGDRAGDRTQAASPSAYDPGQSCSSRSGEGSLSALTPGALVVGLCCVAITCCVVCYAELVVGKIQIGFLQLPPVVVGMLCCCWACKRCCPASRNGSG